MAELIAFMNTLRHDIHCYNVVAITKFSSFAFSWAWVVYGSGTSVTISCCCCWGIRCEEKAEEEKYQVHNKTVFL